MRLGYVILFVADVPKTLAFYEEAFGLQRRFLHESHQYGEMDTGQTILAFVHEEIPSSSCSFRRNRSIEQAAGMEIAFVVDHVEKVFEHAVQSGAIGVLSPTLKPWGQVVSYVRDNNGVLIEICSAVGG